MTAWVRMMTNAWARYWFFPESLTRLAVCRLLAFGLMIADLVYLSPNTFTRSADPMFWEPVLLLRVLHRLLGIGPPLPDVLAAIHIVTVVFAVGAFIGYRTRFCAVASAVLYLYLIAVSFSWFLKVHHTHAVFVLLLLALSVSPCGRALSVDALLARMRSAAERMEFRPEWEPETSPFARWPLRFIGIMIALAYFSAGFAKMKIGGIEWINGESLAYWLLQDADIYAMSLPATMAQHPALLQALSIMVVALQLSFPVILIAPRLVWVYLPAGLGFHMGTFVLMNTHFIWMWWNYMVFIDWDAVGRRLRTWFGIGRRPLAVDIVYDGACPLCIRSMTLLAYLDWFRRLGYRDLMHWAEVARDYPALDPDACIKEMHVVDRVTGRIYRGYFGFRRIAWEVPLLWPLLLFVYIPGVSFVGFRVYGLIAANRLRVADRCTRHTCP